MVSLLDDLCEECLKNNKRYDQRGLKESREKQSNFCLDSSDGKSLINIFKMGKTIVSTRISYKHIPSRPNIDINVSFSNVSNRGSSSVSDELLTNFMENMIRKFINYDSLIIVRPALDNTFQSKIPIWSWNIDIKQSIISNDGSLEVALMYSLQYGLRNLKLPKCKLTDTCELEYTDEFNDCNVLDFNALKIGINNGEYICDLSLKEEMKCDGSCLIVLTNDTEKKLVHISTKGEFIMNSEVYKKLLNLVTDENKV